MTKLTKIQTEALRNLYAGQLPFCRSVQTHNALSHAGLIDFEHGRGWVITNAGLDAIGVEVSVEEEELPEVVQNAAAGELNVTRDKHHRAPQYDVWIGQDHVGVIFDESDADMDREPMAAWSPKAGTKSGVVGFFGLIYEAAEAIRKLYEPAEEAAEEPAPTGRPYTVIYTDGQGPVVHATGCAHNVRDSIGGAYRTEEIQGDLKAVAAKVFEDFIEESGDDPEDFIADLAVKPCAR